MQLRILSSDDVRRVLSMGDAIEGMKDAFQRVSEGRVTMPARSRIDVEASAGVNLFMPSFVPGDDGSTLAIKTVSVYGRNLDRGLPTIHAMVQVIDAGTGVPLAMIEGGSLTAIRTGAASGAATDVLARHDARVVAVFGSGVHARTQLEAVCTARTIERVVVYSRTRDRAQSFAESMAGHGPIPASIDVAADPRSAVVDADIVCCATTSSTPVFDGDDLSPGTHVNAIGSFQPHVQEVDAVTIQRSLVVVDSREAALDEAGDLIIPINDGTISADHIHAELGQIVARSKDGRTSDDQITFFKSCGLAVQDAVAAGITLAAAERAGVGQTIEM